MERRTALALATAAAGTIMAASAAFAVNVGLLEPDHKAPISVVDTSSLEPAAPVDPTVVTIVVEDPPVQSAGTPSATNGASNPTSAGDDGYDDSHEADDDSSGEDSADGEHEERPDDDD